ncbi:hypothetical protein AUC61_02485 [Pseudomonas sp. S25]|uniref:Halovibrin HvnA n=1 Tax=Pseudomonas maioricensis TaxID=1766623 RepID=A0ABS9ZDD1_9PSED|nr:hypothetical protein [Pseudomonas sp. S25]MCI8208392.1 hypothetical protein [Pseudomonas sp. S25]
MNRMWTVGLFATSLMACSTGPAPVSGPSQLSRAGVADQALVDKLNLRYQNTIEQCTEGTPAYYCSGVMLRVSTYNASYPFWTHSPPAAALGSVTFSYIRRDIGSNGSDLGSGFIFSDQETSLAENKAPIVRCIYPFMAGTQNAGRPGSGCGFAATSARQETDLSTCATLATPAVTAPLWLENFRRFGSDIYKQCSLSSLVASQFKASLDAHNGVDAAHTATRNELLIATWREDTPEQLPIEAFFYNAATGGMLNAQSLRHAYYLKTSQKLPIVRVNFAAADKNIFTWNSADQTDGWDVADRLNARYNATLNDCAGRAAYYCNGVIARMTTYGAGFHSWNPNPSGQNDVSFTYLRKDLKFNHAPYMGQVEQGFIFREADAYGQQGVYPLAVLCSFPYDGATAERDGEGCGQNQYFPSVSRLCADQGITSLATWKTHFFSQPLAVNRYRHQCGFRTDPASFALSLIARENPQAEMSWMAHNEILIDRWPQNIPTQLPIEAFIYIYDQSRAKPGLVGAQYIQRDYYAQSRKTAPVISVAFQTGGNNIFSYHPSDQGL